MSGAFGWDGSARQDYEDQNREDIRRRQNNRFDDAKNAYSQPATPQPKPKKALPGGGSAYWNPPQPSKQALPTPNPGASAVWKHNTPPARHGFNKDPRGKKLTSTAENVVIVAVDVTGSLADWVPEIFRRLPLMFKETQGYLGDNLQVLFITYGDSKFGDPIEVINFGDGPVLDDHLHALNRSALGGADGEESPELVGYWILKNVDTSSAKHVYTFFVTDEAGADHMAQRYMRDALDLSPDVEIAEADNMFLALQKRGDVFVILAETPSFYQYESNPGFKGIRDYWNRVLTRACTVPLRDERRTMDVLMGVIAKTTGQEEKFLQALQARQQGTRYTQINMKTVQDSIALVSRAAPPVSAPLSTAEDLLGD